MKKYLFFLLLSSIWVCETITVFSQEEPVSYRRITGYVKDNENHPVAKAKVCGWDKSGRPINGRIPCVESQTNGSFALNVQKWDGDTYTIFVEDFAKGYPSPMSALFEKNFTETQSTDVDASTGLNSVEIRLGAKAGRVILKIVDDVSGQSIESGSVKVCRIDNPQLCDGMSAYFPHGKFEFLTPESPVTLKIELWNGSEWKEWFAIDRNNRKVELIQVKLGETKEIKIRLRQYLSSN